jgi:hypothetical protein
MVLDAKRTGALVLRLLVGLALLGWPRVGSAEGTWSVISLPQQPGEVVSLRHSLLVMEVTEADRQGQP